MKNKNAGNDISKFFRSACSFIVRDTSGKNESKKVIIIIRIIIITFMVYFSANMILCNVTFGETWALIFYGFFLLIFLSIFTMSYYFETSIVLWCFNISTIIWIIAIVHYFGWNIGVQHFLILLLILYFFSSYRHYEYKIIYASFLCLFRLILFYVYQKKIPIWQLNSMEENALQVLNTITIFWCISVISFICSKTSQELEGKLIEYNSQLERQANTDTLTGLYNRRKALEYMNEIVKYPEVHGSFCLCICDIDFFKKVNDSYGHDYGDEVLKKISYVFKEEIQKNIFAARWGGEEFLLVFPDCNGDEAYIELEQIRRKIKDMKICKGDLTVSITMTFGLAEYDFFNGLEATIKEADQKLYMGKERGRDVIIY